MEPPIIVDNFGDLLIFDTVDRAERYLEPLDVLNNEYIAYDSEGRLLHLVARNEFDRSAIEEAESVPHHQQLLREALIGFLSSIGEPEGELRNSALEALVERGLKYPTK